MRKMENEGKRPTVQEANGRRALSQSTASARQPPAARVRLLRRCPPPRAGGAPRGCPRALYRCCAAAPLWRSRARAAREALEAQASLTHPPAAAAPRPAAHQCVRSCRAAPRRLVLVVCGRAGPFTILFLAANPRWEGLDPRRRANHGRVSLLCLRRASMRALTPFVCACARALQMRVWHVGRGETVIGKQQKAGEHEQE